MSDSGRKDFTQKAKEEITPDSSKSTTDKIGETISDTTDRFTRGAQSDQDKSAPQEAFDKAQRVKDDHNGGASSSIGDKVKNALGMNSN